MVDRYDCEYSSTFHDSSMEKRPDGDWVRADDYEALALKLEECQKELEGTKLIAEMRASKLGRRNELLAEGVRRVELLVMALNGASLNNTITPQASEAWIREARESLSDE